MIRKTTPYTSSVFPPALNEFVSTLCLARSCDADNSLSLAEPPCSYRIRNCDALMESSVVMNDNTGKISFHKNPKFHAT